MSRPLSRARAMADDSSHARRCGPPGLIAKSAVPNLKEMGFEEGKTMFGF